MEHQPNTKRLKNTLQKIRTNKKMATATKRATTKAKNVTEQASESVSSMIGLGQETANIALDGMVQTATVANGYTQNMLSVGMNAQEAGLNVARSYVNNMNKIGQDWINLFARTGERTINSISELEFAVQREVTDIAEDVVDNAKKTVEVAQKTTENNAAAAKAAAAK